MPNAPSTHTLRDPSDLLDQPEVCEILRCKPWQLTEWRLRGGLPFIRVGARTVRIRRGDLDAWLDSKREIRDLAS